MPTLDLTGCYKLGDMDDARAKILAVMCFPSDETQRQNFYVSFYEKLAAKGMKEGKYELVRVATRALRIHWLQHSQSGVHSQQASRGGQRRRSPGGDGGIARMMLARIFQMLKAGYPASVHKARYVLEMELREMDLRGTTLASNRETIRQAWTAYKAVAHLWLMYEQLLRVFTISTMEDRLSDLQPSVSTNLLHCLEIAESVRQFGLRYIAPFQGKRGQPVLTSTETWTVVIKGMNVPPPETLCIDPLPASIRSFLDDYPDRDKSSSKPSKNGQEGSLSLPRIWAPPPGVHFGGSNFPS